MISQDQLRAKLLSHFDDADIQIDDFRGDQYHYEVTIVSSHFKNLNQIAQHRLVYNVLGEWVGNAIHALSLNTLEK